MAKPVILAVDEDTRALCARPSAMDILEKVSERGLLAALFLFGRKQVFE